MVVCLLCRSSQLSRYDTVIIAEEEFEGKLRTESTGVVPLMAGQISVVVVFGGEFAMAIQHKPWPGRDIRATSAVVDCKAAASGKLTFVFILQTGFEQEAHT